jgi:hypothetical protein
MLYWLIVSRQQLSWVKDAVRVKNATAIVSESASILFQKLYNGMKFARLS